MSELLPLALVLFTGSVIQTTVGFGFGIFCIPLLIVLGLEPYEAIVFVTIGACVHAIVGGYALRRDVCWPRTAAMIALAGAGIPIGVLALGRLAEGDPAMVRRVFGGIVLLVLLVQLFVRVQPREKLPAGAMVGAMLGSGFMGGFCGMAGVPAVIWVMAHKWSGRESRATLWALFGGLTPVLLLVLWARFGDPIGVACLRALAFLPAVLLGLPPGLWIGRRIPKRRLRTISFVVLAIAGLLAVVGA